MSALGLFVISVKTSGIPFSAFNMNSHVGVILLTSVFLTGYLVDSTSLESQMIADIF